MNLQHSETMVTLKQLFSERYKIDLEKYDEEIFNRHLLGHPFYLSPSDLLYLYFDVEKEFNIRIPEEEIAQGNFATLHQIESIIKQQAQQVG